MSEDLPQQYSLDLQRFAKPERCKICPLLNEPGPVWGVGPEDADIAAFGEAPGADEVDAPQHRSNRFKPFIGGSGRLLTALVHQAGMPRSTMFISNVVKCRPPKNRDPTDVEIACCAPFLQAELNAVNPNVVLALGGPALYALTGKEKITNWRGVPIPGTGGRKIFRMWHPAYIARAQYNWPFAVHDLVRAKAQAEFPDIRRLPIDIIRDANTGRDRESLLAAVRARGACTFDFETTGLSPEKDSIVLVGLTSGPNKAYVFDWTPASRDLFQTILADPGIEIIGQNILDFDLPFSEKKGVDISSAWGRAFDTMVAFHLANASYGQTTVAEQRKGGKQPVGMDKDLTMIASCHTDIPYWKSRDDYQRDLREVCGLDCIATDRAAIDPATGLKKELEALDMTDLYYKHVLPVHPVLYKMTQRGVRVDTLRAARWSITYERTADALESTLREGLGEPNLNFNSPPQLRAVLYGKLKLPVQYAENGNPTVNADALEYLMALAPENAVLESIINLRTFRKMKSTYIDRYLAQGWINPRFGVSKASTGRFNSWDPNAQNIPEALRDIWIPDDDDCLLIAADWSQIEWRLSMILSGDEEGLKLISSGRDSHRDIASSVLRKAYDDVTTTERQSAKYVVYGVGYGRGAASLASGGSRAQRGSADRTGIGAMDRAWVEEFLRGFQRRFHTFFRWREHNVTFVKKNHYLSNSFKRRRWWYTQQVTEVYNYPQQSDAADMMYDILIQLDRELPAGATLRLTVHDEVVINCPKDLIKEALACVRSVMQRTWPQIVEASENPAMVKRFYPNGWFCPVDAGIGTNWKMCKSKDPADKAARIALEKGLGLT